MNLKLVALFLAIVSASGSSSTKNMNGLEEWLKSVEADVLNIQKLHDELSVHVQKLHDKWSFYAPGDFINSTLMDYEDSVGFYKASPAFGAPALKEPNTNALEEWLKSVGMDALNVHELHDEWSIYAPADIINSALMDYEDRVEFREELKEEFGAKFALRWDDAIKELNPHRMLPREEPWLQWNSLFLGEQCSAIGLRQGAAFDSNGNTRNKSNIGLKVNSDFETIQSVVVGRADGFRMPDLLSEPLLDDLDAFIDTGVIANNASKETLGGEGMDLNLVGEEYPQYMIKGMNEGMENMVQQLEARGVHVLRADALGLVDQDSATGWKGHSARDLMIMIGDTLFLSPTAYRSRSHGVDEVYSHTMDYVRENGGKVTDLRTRAYWKAYRGDGFLRLAGEEETDIPITEAIPLFDAANCFVLNEQVVVYLVSISANRAGAELLEAHLAPMGMSVLVIEGVYYGSHIDTTILPLSHSKILFHRDKISLKQMDDLFAPLGYDTFIGVSAADVVPVEMEFNNGASSDIAFNVFQVSASTIMVEAKQTLLAHILESHGFEVIKVPFPYARDFAGSLHCATCPLHRGEVMGGFTAAAAEENSISGKMGICDAHMMI